MFTTLSTRAPRAAAAAAECAAPLAASAVPAQGGAGALISVWAGTSSNAQGGYGAVDGGGGAGVMRIAPIFSDRQISIGVQDMGRFMGALSGGTVAPRLNMLLRVAESALKQPAVAEGVMRALLEDEEAVEILGGRPDLEAYLRQQGIAAHGLLPEGCGAAAAEGPAGGRAAGADAWMPQLMWEALKESVADGLSGAAAGVEWAAGAGARLGGWLRRLAASLKEDEGGALPGGYLAGAGAVILVAVGVVACIVLRAMRC